jgi:hypothetical protein
MTERFVPVTAQLNPNLDVIRRKFDESLARYSEIQELSQWK